MIDSNTTIVTCGLEPNVSCEITAQINIHNTDCTVQQYRDAVTRTLDKMNQELWAQIDRASRMADAVQR
jgi:hypothetical protein